MAEQNTGSPSRCGYGLLGLCCTSCLSGPCRRSPFDEPAAGRHCGEDSDWIVAHNLSERVSRESLRTMASLRNALEAARPGSGTEPSRLAEEVRLLLSPFSREESALLKRIFPEQAFPFLYALGFPSGSWSAALLDAAAAEPGTEDVYAEVERSLRLSAFALAAEELLGELAGRTPDETGIELPETPSPLVIPVSDRDRDGDSGQGKDPALDAIEAACREKVRIVPLRHLGQLPALGRAIASRWGTSAALCGSIVVVSSPSVVPGLGALALGFSALPLPGYPVQGSPRVFDYLTRRLRQRSGNAYLPLDPDEEPMGQIMRGLHP